MSQISRDFACKYLISNEAKKRSNSGKKFSSNVYKFYDANTESFYFPAVEFNAADEIWKSKRVLFDPWPAYANRRTNTDRQIYIGNGGHLFSQTKDDAKLPPLHKPKFLEMIEERINKEKVKYSVTEDASNVLRLQIYRSAFDLFINHCAYYAPMLATIKTQYDDYIGCLHAEIKRLQPIQELIFTVSMESERRVMEAKVQESSEIQKLKNDKLICQSKIEKLKQECVDMDVTTKKLSDELEKQADGRRLESDGRKMLLIEVNDLTSRLHEMEQLARAEADTNAEDPIRLKIQTLEYQKALTLANHKLAVLQTDFEAKVSKEKYYEVSKKLIDAEALNAKFKDDLDAANIRYELLQEHCNSLSTFRDLYNLQLTYITRVIYSKGEPTQKLEYMSALLSKYRKLASNRSPEELATIVEDEMERMETGTLPVMTRQAKRNDRGKVSTVENG